MNDWTDLTPRQRLALLDLMKATVQAELDKSAAEMSAEIGQLGIPARIEIQVLLVIDPNRDPRLEK